MARSAIDGLSCYILLLHVQFATAVQQLVFAGWVSWLELLKNVIGDSVDQISLNWREWLDLVRVARFG